MVRDKELKLCYACSTPEAVKKRLASWLGGPGVQEQYEWRYAASMGSIHAPTSGPRMSASPWIDFTLSRLPTHHQDLKVYYLQFVQKSNCGLSQALSSLFPAYFMSSEFAIDLPCRSDDRGHTAQGSYRSAVCHLFNAPASGTEPMICRNFGWRFRVSLLPTVLTRKRKRGSTSKHFVAILDAFCLASHHYLEGRLLSPTLSSLLRNNFLDSLSLL